MATQQEFFDALISAAVVSDDPAWVRELRRPLNPYIVHGRWLEERHASIREDGSRYPGRDPSPREAILAEALRAALQRINQIETFAQNLVAAVEGPGAAAITTRVTREPEEPMPEVAPGESWEPRPEPEGEPHGADDSATRRVRRRIER